MIALENTQEANRMSGDKYMKKKDVIAGILKNKLEYIVVFLIFAFFSLFSLTEIGVRVELQLYNTLLMLKPSPRERSDILLVDINDSSIEKVGAWPWSRDIIADVLIRMRECGVKATVFDIEYLNPGQVGVNRAYVKNVFPYKFAAVRDDIVQNVRDFSRAVADKTIPLEWVPDVGEEMVGLVQEGMNGLSDSIHTNIFRDNDAYLANALRFFGNAYLTIDTENISESTDSESAKEYARENLLLKNVVDPLGLIVRENELTRKEALTEGKTDIAPAILPLLKAVRGAGFPNVVIDSDGVRRRIPLLVEHRGGYVAQLVFAPLVDILDPQTIVRKGNRLVLVDALDPDDTGSGKRKSISIPLDENGRFLINWLNKKYINDLDPTKTSFRHLPVISFKDVNDLEDTLGDYLGSILELEIKNADGYLSYHNAALALRSARNDLESWKEGLLSGQRDDFDAYFAAKRGFFDSYGKFLSGGYDEEIYAALATFSKFSGDNRYADMKKRIRTNFGIYRECLAEYLSQSDALARECAGAFCILGNSATGNTDFGVNPFDRHYANVGTHANIYNTVMTGQFITPLPKYVSFLVAFVLCLLCALANRRLKSLKGRIGVGIGATAFSLAIVVSFFAATGIYIQLFTPLLSVFFTFLLITILKFVFSEQEKSFLRKAFTMYLSSDVVNEIVNDPSRLKLGGQEKRITALFTDIKSFSTLSEKVTPEHLVQILNKYLTVMSDLVLEQKGTIDKYIGDAIVSFFGAPIDLPDHAKRACLAAVRMKQAEERLNGELMAAGETPMPIYTRIGINTGAMVVGNMGTDNKMNYTIMGNDVNLAARLEGVNKQYGTWILVSESTWNETDGAFLGRKLDRVRVVGIETPVQLYNIMAVRAEASGKQVALAEKFNAAIDAYREQRFGDALLLFTKCAELDPDDAAAKLFLERVTELAKNGASADWSDVINMTSK